MLHNKTLLVIFAVVVLGFLALDLGVLRRRSKVVSFKESVAWTVFWFAMAAAFAGVVYYYQGQAQALTFATAYLVEQSLSIDNLFVFILIFESFKILPEMQHRVLFWGIMGALIMRAVCIGVGVVALQHLHWLVYVFGAILVFAGLKTAFESEDRPDDFQGSWMLRALRRVLPVTDQFDDERFFTRIDGSLLATPLFLALVAVEVSDLIFAVDSIPAVLAISRDPFIAYTSNIFAILGLRSIYFAIAHLMKLCHYLKYALAVILIFVGVKIAVSHYVEISNLMTLGVVALSVTVAVIASIVIKPAKSST